jgi:hypothetical protein
VRTTRLASAVRSGGVSMCATSSARRGAVSLEDLGYELQLLIGADEIVSLIKAHDSQSQNDADKFGNLVNYFKDSVYVHARNLLNTLTNEYETEIGRVPASIRSEPYGKIKDSLETYVAHIKKPRDQQGVSNVRDGRHLNEYVHDLTAEARRCWTEWVDLTKDPASQHKLRGCLDKAILSAQDDATRLERLVKGLA